MRDVVYIKRIIILVISALLIHLGGCSTAPPSGEQVDAEDDMPRSNRTKVRKEEAETELINATPVEDTAVTEFVLKPLNPEQEAAAQEALRDYEKGLKYLKKGENERALTMMQSLTERFPNLSGPWTNQAIIYMNLNQLDKAGDALERALEIYPDNPFSLNLLGIVQREAGEFTKAKKSYQKALKIDKQYAKAHLNLGILADLYLRDFELALSHFEQYQALQQEADKRVKGWIKDLQRRIKATKAAAAKQAEAS